MIDNSPLQNIESSLFSGHELWIKRDDLLHPQISGNKYRKLKYILAQEKPPMVISMGGPWSNHLHALAYACHEKGWPSVGLVRGLVQEHQELSACLRDCQAWGMRLHFVSRIDYRLLRQDPHYWKQLLPGAPHNALWIAEGGRSAEALRGLQELTIEVQQQLGADPDYLVCACGTGTTLAGIVAGAYLSKMSSTKIVGICAISNGQHLRPQIDELIKLVERGTLPEYQLFTEFHHGGFAKSTEGLRMFCLQFSRETGIAIEPVYTGKMLFALSELCRSGYFRPEARIVAVHTGGLQGTRSGILASH